MSRRCPRALRDSGPEENGRSDPHLFAPTRLLDGPQADQQQVWLVLDLPDAERDGRDQDRVGSDDAADMSVGDLSGVDTDDLGNLQCDLHSDRYTGE